MSSRNMKVLKLKSKSMNKYGKSSERRLYYACTYRIKERVTDIIKPNLIVQINILQQQLKYHLFNNVFLDHILKSKSIVLYHVYKFLDKFILNT